MENGKHTAFLFATHQLTMSIIEQYYRLQDATIHLGDLYAACIGLRSLKDVSAICSVGCYFLRKTFWSGLIINLNEEAVRKVHRSYHSVIQNVVKNLFFHVFKSRSFDKLKMTEQNDRI